MKKIIPFFCMALLFSSCNGDALLPNASGAAGELLVVVDENVWRTEGGKALFDLLTTDVPCLPQAEPMFSISRVSHKQFDNLLHPTRNIVIVTIDSTQYTHATVKFERNRWSRSQAIAVITSNNSANLKKLLDKKGERLLTFFVDAERERQIEYMKGNVNSTALQKVYDKFGIKIAVPTSLNKYNEDDNFLWISNGSGMARQDIVIYSYTYTSKSQWSRESLIAMRDSVLCTHIPGSVEGSCIGTATSYEPPIWKEMMYNDAYCAELRGLWEMKNGEMMGGPFISHTRLDELHNRLITIEGFVFAPSKEKRNLTRQVEAMVYSVQMPQDVEALVVTPQNEK